MEGLGRIVGAELFNRGSGVSDNPDQSSGFVVLRSTQNDGASWNFPGRSVTVFYDHQGAGTTLEDKQLMTIDNNPSSRFRDRIYVTWTLFASDGTAYIYRSTETSRSLAARAVRQLIDRFCQGSVEELVTGMVDANVLSREEMKRLEELVRSQRKGGK